MAHHIKWSPHSISQFEEICEFIAKDSKHYAALFAQKIVFIVKNIPRFPKAGRVVPEFDDVNLREKIYKNYRIVYRLKTDVVEIVAVCHSARPLDDLYLNPTEGT